MSQNTQITMYLAICPGNRSRSTHISITNSINLIFFSPISMQLIFYAYLALRDPRFFHLEVFDASYSGIKK